MITVTENAVKHLRGILAEKGADPREAGLRLFIQRGGCAGHQYAMKIAASEEGDAVVERDGVRIFVDPESLPFLEDAEVDYVDTLNDSGFKISNPNAARSCGCGTSFEPAVAGQAPQYDSSMNGSVCGGETDDDRGD